MASYPAEITTSWLKTFLADPFSEGDRIYSDTISERKALELRIQGKRAAWVSRYKGMTTLGYAVVAKGIVERRIVTPQEARSLNETVRNLKDRDAALVKPFLDNYFSLSDDVGRQQRKSLEAAERSLARERGEIAHAQAWTFQKAIDNWIEQRSRADQKKPFQEPYIKELRSVYARPEFADVLSMPITKLTRKMGEDIRDAVARNSGTSAVKKAVRGIRACLDYTYEKHLGQCGLEGHQPWWLKLTYDGIIEPSSREPTIDEIGKVLSLGEYFLDHRLPGRIGVQHGVRDNVFAAFLWIVLSSQRVTSALALRDGDITPWSARGEGGWYLASWRPSAMKNRKRFVLPIPPRAATILGYWMYKIRHLGASEWAFPSEDGKNTKVNSRSPLAMIERLSGKMNTSKKETEKEDGEENQKKPERVFVDLLALNGISHWSSHDVRRALTTEMEAQGIPGGASVVLSHTIDIGEPEKKMSDAQFEIWARNKVAKITGESYGDIQHLKLKGDAMLIWSTAVLDSWQYWRTQPLFVDFDKTVIVEGMARTWEEMESATA
jgi:integrase